MKLWLISQDVNNDYDTYDSAVVAAETEQEARLTYPSNGFKGCWFAEGRWLYGSPRGFLVADFAHRSWALPSQVKVEYLGETEKPAGSICASFNAG